MKAALFIVVRNLAISAGLLICEVQEGFLNLANPINNQQFTTCKQQIDRVTDDPWCILMTHDTENIFPAIGLTSHQQSGSG
jgi:hypothetical protein